MQSAAQSTAFGTRQGAAGRAQQNLMSQGYQTGAFSSQGGVISQDGQTGNSRAQINRTISGDGDSKSVDGPLRHTQGSVPNQLGSAELGSGTLAAAMAAQAGLDLSMDEQRQRHGTQGGQRPTTSVPMGYRGLMGSRDAPLMPGQVPHALYNHQAYSKKSFRIRGQAE